MDLKKHESRNLGLKELDTKLKGNGWARLWEREFDNREWGILYYTRVQQNKKNNVIIFWEKQEGTGQRVYHTFVERQYLEDVLELKTEHIEPLKIEERERFSSAWQRSQARKRGLVKCNKHGYFKFKPHCIECKVVVAMETEEHKEIRAAILRGE